MRPAIGEHRVVGRNLVVVYADLVPVGEVVGDEERFDLREWRLLPRSDKPDRFSLTRGMTEGDDDRNVISFKAENKAEGNKWTDHIKAATVALRNESKDPTAAKARCALC